MSAPSRDIASQEHPARAADSRHVTDRMILWGCVLLTVALTAARLSAQLFERIEADARVQDLASGLEDPALADLAVRMGVLLAVMMSVVFQIIYLFLCATVDEKILQSTMTTTRNRTNRKGRRVGIGPAFLTGVAATVPVQVTALVLGLSSPKDELLLYIWLAILVALCTTWACRRLMSGARMTRNRIIVTVILASIAAISLLF